MRQPFVGLARVQFPNRPAPVAKQKDGCVSVRPVTAGNEGVEALYSVGESHLDEKVQRAIYGRWFCGSVVAEPLKHVVGLDRPICLEKECQHCSTKRRERTTASAAKVVGFSQTIREVTWTTRKMKVGPIHGVGYRRRGCETAGRNGTAELIQDGALASPSLWTNPETTVSRTRTAALEALSSKIVLKLADFRDRSDTAEFHGTDLSCRIRPSALSASACRCSLASRLGVGRRAALPVTLTPSGVRSAWTLQR